LIQTSSQRRKYFDSGDFALSQAHREPNIGHIGTGTEHPLRGSIPHPSSPVPGDSNIKDDPNSQKRGVEDRYKVKEASNLHQRMSTDKKPST
ncbi:hypothetical protein K469DRAFT_581018, partial [Zopfia rhizophila CBS 207.26]